jgi:hypothetical protein
VTRDGRSTWAFVFAPKARGFGSTNYSKLAKRVLAQDLPAGYQLEATGLQELANNTSAKGPGIFAETMLGALGALAGNGTGVSAAARRRPGSATPQGQLRKTAAQSFICAPIGRLDMNFNTPRARSASRSGTR